MTEVKKNLPKWILIISGIFAILELMVSIQLCFSPQSVMENADLKAEGVKYLIYMWAARQFALGFILAFATIKKVGSHADFSIYFPFGYVYWGPFNWNFPKRKYTYHCCCCNDHRFISNDICYK